METLLILGALGALLFSGLMVASVLARARRPELRMAREADLLDEAEDEDLLLRGLEPVPLSPIDRTAPVIEIAPEPLPPEPVPARLTQEPVPETPRMRRRDPHGEEH